MKRYGCIPDFADRAPRFSGRRPTQDTSWLPAETDLSIGLPPRLNQLNEGCCVAHGVTSALRYNWINNNRPDIPLSRNQLYYDCRKREGTIASDAGCQISTAIDVAVEVGVARESLWPYDVTRWSDAPPAKAYADATKHQGIGKWRVDVNPLSMRVALAVGHPVIIGISVYESFESDFVANTGIIPMPKSSEKVVGGHCMLVFARKPGWFGVRNWWGEDWGKGGDCWMPETYFTDEYAADLWYRARSRSNLLGEYPAHHQVYRDRRHGAQSWVLQ
jgi:C1A family cysteine protease